MLGDDPVPARHQHTAFGGTLTEEQSAVAEAITRRWHRAVELAWPDEYDEALQRPRVEEDQRPLALLGPAESLSSCR